MAPQKRSTSSRLSTFSIVTIVIAVAMIVIVATTIFQGKQQKKAQGKIEYSDVAQVSAATVNGSIGESKLAPYTKEAGDSEIGKIVPAITAQDFSGKQETITPGEKPYVLAFVAHWCPHCQKEVPKIVSLYDSGKIPKNVEFIAVATATDPKRPNYPPSGWLFDENWPWRKIADTKNSTIGDAFGVGGYPFLVYVNADGTLAARSSGEQEESSIISNVNAISKTAKNK